MPRAKTTDEQILIEKKKLLSEIGLTVPGEISSANLFKKLKRLGYSRHRIVKYVLEVKESVGRKIDLGGNYTITFDKDFKATVTKNTGNK